MELVDRRLLAVALIVALVLILATHAPPVLLAVAAVAVLALVVWG